MLSGLAAATGCIKPQQPPAAAGPPEPPKVYVELPSTGDITDYEDFTGRTVAIKTIDIRARVTGYLTKINFSEKDAAMLQAVGHLNRVDLDFKRATKTIDKKVISQEQFDLVAGDRNEAQAAVEVAKANRNMARLNLSFTKVRSPISGRVGRTQLDTGNLVRADETILTTVVSMDPMYAYFDVDERTMLRLHRYAEEGRIELSGERAAAVPVKMGLADEEGYPHDGVVNFVDNRLDPSTGTLQVRGIFKNSDRMLSPGMFVRVRLPIGESYRALLVAEQALGTDQGQKFVFVIDADNRAQYRRVQVGKLQQGQRVVLKGLSAGERVVVSGLQRVRPGAIVQPMVESTAELSTEQGSAVAEAPTTGTGMSQK